MARLKRLGARLGSLPVSAVSAVQPIERKRGSAGVTQRARRLARTDGLCEMCLAEDRIERALFVDHVMPLALGGSDEDGNTRNLCEPHHDAVTAEQFGTKVARR